MAVTSAADRFDQLLDAARTEAREFPHGVTITFTPDAYGDGFVARLYHSRPGTEPLAATTIPPLQARVSLRETDELGAPAFAIAIHANGTIGGLPGDVTRGASSELNCPDSQRFHFTFAYAGFVVDRYLPCRIQLAATGPVSLITYATATPQPSPSIDVCSSASCTLTAPPQPAVTATCPPNYTQTTGGQCLANFVVCSSSPAGTILGPDADGIHEDISSGASCATPTPTSAAATPTPPTVIPTPTQIGCVGSNCFGGPGTSSPTPTAGQIVEVQIWAVFSGPHEFATQTDGETFILYSDGSESDGAAPAGATWACSVREPVIAPSGGTVWGGFYKKPGDVTFQPQYDRMYQEANNTGGDGYLAETSDLACI